MRKIWWKECVEDAFLFSFLFTVVLLEGEWNSTLCNKGYRGKVGPSRVLFTKVQRCVKVQPDRGASTSQESFIGCNLCSCLRLPVLREKVKFASPSPCTCWHGLQGRFLCYCYNIIPWTRVCKDQLSIIYGIYINLLHITFKIRVYYMVGMRINDIMDSLEMMGQKKCEIE